MFTHKKGEFGAISVTERSMDNGGVTGLVFVDFRKAFVVINK